MEESYRNSGCMRLRCPPPVFNMPFSCWQSSTTQLSISNCLLVDCTVGSWAARQPWLHTIFLSIAIALTFGAVAKKAVMHIFSISQSLVSSVALMELALVSSARHQRDPNWRFPTVCPGRDCLSMASANHACALATRPRHSIVRRTDRFAARIGGRKLIILVYAIFIASNYRPISCMKKSQRAISGSACSRVSMGNKINEE